MFYTHMPRLNNPNRSNHPVLCHTTRKHHSLHRTNQTSTHTCPDWVALWIPLQPWWQGVRGEGTPDEQRGLRVQPQGLCQHLPHIWQGLYVV